VTSHQAFHPYPRKGRNDAQWLRSSLKKVFEVDDIADFGHLLACLDEPARRSASGR
jgi:hypothetical protein